MVFKYASIPFDAIVHQRIERLFLVPFLVNAFTKHPATSKYAWARRAPEECRHRRCPARQQNRLEHSAVRTKGPTTQGFEMTERCGLICGLPDGTSPCAASVRRVLQSTEAKNHQRAWEQPPAWRTRTALCATPTTAPRPSRQGIKCLPPAELEGYPLGLDLMDNTGVAGSPSEWCVAAGQQADTANPDAVQRVPRLPSGKFILHLVNATKLVPMAVNLSYIIHLERQRAHGREAVHY
ncbi:hypothetical protein B0H19DRAFT_1258505 [Mycena capillaripes]|nr:hypothetical protein B0H19DRAFT_1258505 [Mycena capillaripes]